MPRRRIVRKRWTFCENSVSDKILMSHIRKFGPKTTTQMCIILSSNSRILCRGSGIGLLLAPDWAEDHGVLVMGLCFGGPYFLGVGVASFVKVVAKLGWMFVGCVVLFGEKWFGWNLCGFHDFVPVRL
ncbi:unnamed protein product [Amaranthus hypochondriacus]